MSLCDRHRHCEAVHPSLRGAVAAELMPASYAPKQSPTTISTVSIYKMKPAVAGDCFGAPNLPNYTITAAPRNDGQAGLYLGKKSGINCNPFIPLLYNTFKRSNHHYATPDSDGREMASISCCTNSINSLIWLGEKSKRKPAASYNSGRVRVPPRLSALM